MKLRIGFVSNSSSSSYVIAVGRVTNQKKLEQVCQEFKLNPEFYTTEEILKDEGWNSPLSKTGDNLYFKEEAFDGNQIRIPIDPSKDELFVRFSDCDDCDENDWGETLEPDDYDFTKIWDLKEEHGIIDIEATCGCGYGRNG